MDEHERLLLRHQQQSPSSILVIGLDTVLNQLFVDALKSEFDCFVLLAASSKLALEMATLVKLDLVIIDDERNALELSARLRGIAERANLPIIITGSVAGYERDSSHTIFLHKPFDVLQFYTAVKQALNASDE